MQKVRTTLFLLFIFTSAALAQVDKSDWKNGVPEGCTTITVGKDASADGSVMTSHTDDSHRTRSWMDVQPPKDHPEGATTAMYKRTSTDSLAMPAYKHTKIGEIPQVEHTYGYLNTAYPCINEKQLAIGESTFGGRDELQSDEGLIDCQRLAQLMLERTATAREAIKMAGDLLDKYGWNDAGEALTIADPQEVWHFEVVGPGKGKTGAIWVAQRVPDDHIAVNANASTIKEIDLDNPDFFMASENIKEIAKEEGYWNPDEEPFRFNHVFAPESRTTFASRRREWRVYDLLAPSVNIDPRDKDFPFSVKPDEKVSVQDMIHVFQDYYEDTEFDMTKHITTTNEDGETVKSPHANPFMPYDEYGLYNINGGWGELGERTIARWYTMYATIIQCRADMPDDVGGLVWMAQDNVASSVYVPFYSSLKYFPESYRTPGRVNGFTRKSAWWAFNRMGTLAAQRWGDMRHDVRKVWDPMQEKMFEAQKAIEEKALKLEDKEARAEMLNKFSNKWGEKAVKRAWELGDELWTKYDEKF